ncbi:MAG: TolC family protein [Fibrobacteria bacterium]
MHSPFLFIRALAAGFGVAIAGQGITLDQAVQRALQRNPGFAVLESEIEAAEGNKAASAAMPNPNLSFGPGIKHASGGGSGNSFHGELALEQTFEYPGKRRLRLLLAEGNIQARKLAREGLAQEIRIVVKRAFFRALAAEQVEALRLEQVQSAQTFLLAARKRVEGGYASDFESMKAQADLIAARKALGEAGSEITRTKFRLSALMGSPADTAFTLEGKLDASVFAAPAVDAPMDPVEIALAHNPAIRIQALQAERSAKNLQAADMARKPDLSVAPSLEYTRGEQVYGLSLSLPLPVWNRGRGEVRQATGEYRASQAELEKLKQEVALAVREAQEKVRLSEAQLALYTPEFLEGLKGIMQRAEKVYGQSSTTLLIYLESKRSYFESLSDYYEALSAWTESHIDLEAAMGTPLDADTDKNGVK